MSDIKEIRQKIENGEYTYRPILEAGEMEQLCMADEEILSLITIIESQKETIDDQYMTISTANMWNSKLKDELDSLKAITELAVKGLEEVFKACKKRTFNDCGDLRAVVYDTSQAALEEIERLTNGTT